jgi:uncharacterized membrane protein YkgB
MIDAIERRTAVRPVSLDARGVEIVGRVLLRYGLVFLLVSSALAKFTSAEAELIHPLMAHSPLCAWLYGVTSVQGASNLIGVVELVLGILLTVHRWWPRIAALGGLAVTLEFVFTVSFLFTTPNLSPEMVGFLSKDVMLLGVAVWLTGESLRAARPTEAR